MKRLMLLMLAVWFAAASVDPSAKLIRLEATLYAKMVFLDYEFQKKLQDGKVAFVILYDSPKHRRIALEFAAALNGSEVLGRRVTAEVFRIDRFDNKRATAYIAVLSEKHLKQLADRLPIGRLLFVYDETLIPYGMVSMRVGVRMTPVINPVRLKRAGIELRPIIFKVAKVYDAAY